MNFIFYRRNIDIKKNVVSIIAIIAVLGIGLFILTGCGNKEEDGDYKITGGGLNSIEGVYELYEVKVNKESYTGKEWTDMTTLDCILTMNNDKTATVVETYKENMDGKTVQKIEKYTYDDNAFYGVESDNTKEGVKYFTCEFKDGMISLTVVNDSHNSMYIYKHK